MSSKVSSLEEKVKLPPTETISRCYQPPGKNRKVIRILTVAVYVLCVSLAAIMLSLYYIFIWDPTIRPFVTKGNQCDKIVIPEKIAIRLLNSSEVTAEQFYKHILEQYRLLNQLQQQRQQFLQKQHIHLQQLAAANKFQEIFATATIIQANAHDPLRKPITPTNGTFLLDPSQPIVNSLEPRIPILDTAQAPIPVLAPASALATALSSSSSSSSSSAALAAASATNGHTKRKSHRKHYNNNNHHRHTSRKNHRKSTVVTGNGNGNNNADNNNNSNNDYEPEPFVVESPPMNPPILSVVQEPYTQLPIPLVLNSREDKRPLYYTHSERRGGSGGARKRAGYETQTYMNPLLTGELIFEK